MSGHPLRGGPIGSLKEQLQVRVRIRVTDEDAPWGFASTLALSQVYCRASQ